MAKLKPPVNQKDHIQGNPGASIELVEYGDYQCPYCGQAYLIIKSIQAKTGDQLKFVFRNFPLTEIHQRSAYAAVAAEAAGFQGKFWEMHDILFENQKNLQDEDLIRYAEQLNLDIKKFQEDFRNREYKERVESDFESGVRSGVNATPSFFINGAKYEGSFEDMVHRLEKLVETT
jgi:protein-disulfide isomerase